MTIKKIALEVACLVSVLAVSIRAGADDNKLPLALLTRRAV